MSRRTATEIGRNRRLLTYSQVAEQYGLNAGTLAAYVHLKLIPHVRLGRRLVRFDSADIDGWINERRVRAERLPRSEAVEHNEIQE
jgi:excisionase family DNA binding protein